jgi:hypothetical protein
MMDLSNTTSHSNLLNIHVKRGRGRPAKIKLEDSVERVKRPRGRPRKEVTEKKDDGVKRSRGRPRKYPVLAKEKQNGEMKSVIKKVDSGFLLKHMFQYFTKLLVLHQELSKEAGKNEVIFKRLRVLDFQMAEVCKQILTSEYQNAISQNTDVEMNSSDE